MKKIFITGVSTGLGLALAKLFLDQNHAVYGLSRKEPPNLANIEKFHFQKLDLSKLDEIPPVLSRLIGDTLSFDLVILNAGVLGRIADLKETGVAEMKATMETNLWANKVVLDQLLANGRLVRQVVAISSGASVNAFRGWNGYSLSKAALNMMVALYAAENEGTHFTSLAPGLIDSAMQGQIRGFDPDPRFASLETLKSLQGTKDMPLPENAALLLSLVFPQLLSRPNGSFVDATTLNTVSTLSRLRQELRGKQ